jgi:hypothetical protein
MVFGALNLSKPHTNRDILPLMNYRRGLQRVYAVLTVGWIVTLLFAQPPNRLKFWSLPIDYDALAKKAGAISSSPPVDYDALAQQARAISSSVDYTAVTKQFGGTPVAPSAQTGKDWFAANAPKSSEPFRPPPLSSWKGSAADSSDAGTFKLAPPSSWQGPADLSSLGYTETSRLGKLLWLLGVLLIPPAIGYGLLFYLARWVYRGFRPAAQV